MINLAPPKEEGREEMVEEGEEAGAAHLENALSPCLSFVRYMVLFVISLRRLRDGGGWEAPSARQRTEQDFQNWRPELLTLVATLTLIRFIFR